MLPPGFSALHLRMAHIFFLAVIQQKQTGSTGAGLRRPTDHHGMTGLIPLELGAPWAMGILAHQ